MHLFASSPDVFLGGVEAPLAVGHAATKFPGRQIIISSLTYGYAARPAGLLSYVHCAPDSTSP